ncbi:MAG TPA: MiaB/RimO family radical SAM methylthiotransferase [Chitinophagaceae bacterium]|nr:MiaB/RimO family radical SAM methylthiotransferase [Chitinophagaceae bacterium]
MFELTHNKIHDEKRQGEAFTPVYVAEPSQKKFYIESYGCAMNFADSEVVASILFDKGYGVTQNLEQADLIFLNTCSIREKAELTVRKRLTEFRKLKKENPGLLVGVLGCMAERLKSKFIEEEKLVDMVVGPDAYRTLPGLIEEAESGQKGVNVLLSRDETYGDIAPIRLNSNGVTAFVSIMRGCNNMCSFCVVPFTRGRERSRDAESIIKECKDLFENGFREITLLGQNVDSYNWSATRTIPDMEDLAYTQIAGLEGDKVSPSGGDLEAAAVTFADLLEKVALVSPLLRVRFSTSHPKDITDEVLFVMKKYDNICKYIHLPVQSGSTRILQMMNRTYSREWYISKINRIREILPGCGLSTDMITGFCTETEEDHQETLSLMKYCGYELAYMYYYSERPGTLAERRYKDDVPEEIKKRRLQEVIALHRIQSLAGMQKEVGKTAKVLIEGNSKKSDMHWAGRSDNNKVVVFPKTNNNLSKGSYANVLITGCTAGTLIGNLLK